ncbi:hypothetical protein PpBr36_01598 [Pyricularia pennisetigena]|uniref:hypothetical protein n=1 Tax=Pyricularia pennisetigena TaxID=1578925 RepID=UPI001152D174|nr:hypothetical protein PpBr36_01598 [Pyricularia pennisetigena]TLS27881.1 hypothetical protein PpBr36_01598 [Pyricularia pennisetigena]
MAIKALLFDCDNTLVLSEELAFEGCASLINQICEVKGLNIPPFTGETLIKEFVGQNFRGMLLTLQKKHGMELTADELEVYVKREEEVVIGKLKEALVPCEGVVEQLEALHESGKYTMAVVSSSAGRRLDASLEKVGFKKYFGDRVYSAATSINPPTSKPDPAIYLHAMKQLGFSAEECVAIEDSKSGTSSACRAGIKTVGYVGPYEDAFKPEMEKTLKDVAGACTIMRHWSEFPECLRKIEAGEV